MKVLLILVICFLLGCNSKRVYKELAQTNIIDPDIILFNIGNSDRIEIATLLLNIEKCNPLIVGVDVIFKGYRQPFQDSVLANAFEKVNNDILAYLYDSTGKKIKAIDKFRKFATNEGYTNLEIIDGISSHFTPIIEVKGELSESFSLKIVKQWKPGFKHNLSINEPIPILFQRSQKQYYYFVNEDLLDKNVCELVKNKIVLVGYLGPNDEDKHFTPVGNNYKDHERIPDTYGLVIEANAIRTILEYEKRE